MTRPKTRIVYMEQKTGANAGEARIGRVRFSRSGRTLYYKDKVFRAASGGCVEGNYLGYDRQAFAAWVNKPLELEKGILPGYLGEFWISGPKKNGQDRHALEQQGLVEVDEDVAEEYWREIRARKLIN